MLVASASSWKSRDRVAAQAAVEAAPAAPEPPAEAQPGAPCPEQAISLKWRVCDRNGVALARTRDNS